MFNNSVLLKERKRKKKKEKKELKNNIYLYKQHFDILQIFDIKKLSIEKVRDKMIKRANYPPIAFRSSSI